MLARGTSEARSIDERLQTGIDGATLDTPNAHFRLPYHFPAADTGDDCLAATACGSARATFDGSTCAANGSDIFHCGISSTFA